MKIKIISILLITLSFIKSTSCQDIFTNYCKPGLCPYGGGDGKHSGCKDGVPHDGKFQRPDCPDNAEIIPLTDSDKQDILDFHNVQRNFVACGGLFKEYGFGPGCRHGVVTWDKELEKTAFLHTSYCDFNHDKCRNTEKYPLSGQNLGLLTYEKTPEKSIIYINVISYLWYIEYTGVKKETINKFFYQPKPMVGHFLTSLNERNNRVGCTFAKFFYKIFEENVVMLSCNYPSTSIGDGAIYNSCKEPASKCTKGTDSKYKFLCSSEEIYDVSDRLTHIPYDGDGSEVFDNCGKQPELYHYSREGANDVREFHKMQYPHIPMPVEKPAAEPKKKPIEITTKKSISGTTKKTVVTKPGKDSAAATTTVKPALQKPKKDSGTPAVQKPPIHFPEGNPEAGGIADYSEDEYDAPDSSFVMLWHEYFYQSIFFVFLILFVF